MYASDRKARDYVRFVALLRQSLHVFMTPPIMPMILRSKFDAEARMAGMIRTLTLPLIPPNARFVTVLRNK